MSSTKEHYIWPHRKHVCDANTRRQVIRHLSRSTQNLRQCRDHLLSVHLVGEDKDFAEYLRARYERLWCKISENSVAVSTYNQEIGYMVVVFNFDVETRGQSVNISDCRRYH